MPEPDTIKLETHVNFPAEKVWRALTEPALLTEWWAPGDIAPIVGHEFTLDMGGQFGKQVCQIIEVEPKKRLSYLFSKGMLNTTISWTLTPDGNGTRITLAHAGFNLDSPIGKMAFGGMGAGWPMILKRIEPALAQMA